MPPKWWNQPPCTLPPGRTASSVTPSSLTLIFGWLLCVGLPIGSRLRPLCILYLLFFAPLHLTPQMMGRCPPTRSAPDTPPLIHPTYRGHQPLVSYYVLLLNSCPLRPRPHSSLYFSMGLVLAPQSMEPAMARVHQTPRACYRLMIGSGSTKIWSHSGCCHGNRGPKLLEGRAAAAHVGCCVFWLCFVLWHAVEHCILPSL